MYKHNRAFKLTVAKRYLSGESSSQLSEELNINSRLIRYWAQVFSIHKLDAFVDGHDYCTAEAKLSALNVMWTNEWSIGHTSAVLNLSSPGILSTWQKRYLSDGIKGLHTKTKGRPKMQTHSKSPATKV